MHVVNCELYKQHGSLMSRNKNTLNIKKEVENENSELKSQFPME